MPHFFHIYAYYNQRCIELAALEGDADAEYEYQLAFDFWMDYSKLLFG